LSHQPPLENTHPLFDFMSSRYPLRTRPSAAATRGRNPRVFGNIPAVGNTRVASPDVSNHELDDEPAGPIFVSGNLVPKSGGNTDDGSQALTDVHGDPVDDLGPVR